jgi:hypothetical protein
LGFGNSLIDIMTILTLSMLTGILAAIAAALKYVPAGHVYSVHRGKQPPRLLQPGLHWVVPGLDRVANRIDLGGQTLHFEDPGAGTPTLQGTVYWQVLEPERADPVMAEAEQLIRNSVLTALRNETMDEGGHGRLGRVLDGRVKQQLNHELRPRGMMVTRVELATAA